MATKPKGGKKNGPKREKDVGVLQQPSTNLFGDFEEIDVAFDWGEVNPAQLHSIIRRVVRVGGYISFAAPAGGASVKYSVSFGGSELKQWCAAPSQLLALLARTHTALTVVEGDAAPPRRLIRGAGEIVPNPSGPQT